MGGEVIVGVAIGVSIIAITGGVRWAVSTGIRQTVNGQIAGVAKQVDRVHTRLDEHDKHHMALMAALVRQGIEPPDGWK